MTSNPPTKMLPDDVLLQKLRKGAGLKNFANAQRAYALLGLKMEALPKPHKGFVLETPEHGTFEVGTHGYAKVPEYAYSYGIYLHVPDAQRDVARAFQLWLKAAAAKKLGAPTIEEERAEGERARDYKTDFTIRTCPVCFRDIKATKGVMADHGYTVQWHSFQGRCPGVRAKPWEVSPAATEKYLKQLIEHAESVRKRIETVGKDGHALHIENFRTKKLETVEPNDTRYPRIAEQMREKLQSELRQIVSPRFGGIPWYRMAIRTWTPGSADAPAVGAPRGAVTAEDEAGFYERKSNPKWVKHRGSKRLSPRSGSGQFTGTPTLGGASCPKCGGIMLPGQLTEEESRAKFVDPAAMRQLTCLSCGHRPAKGNPMRANPGPDDPATARFYIGGVPIWDMHPGHYLHKKGVHDPWIMEISPMQYAGLSGRGKREYDAKRDREWSGAAAAKQEWRALVQEAVALGLVDPKTLRDEAKSVYWSGVAAASKQSAEDAFIAARVANADTSSLAKGDICWSIMASGYVRITKLSAKSARGDRVGSTSEHGRDMKLQRGALEWLSYNDTKAATESGASTTAEFKAIAQTKGAPEGARSNPARGRGGRFEKEAPPVHDAARFALFNRLDGEMQDLYEMSRAGTLTQGTKNQLVARLEQLRGVMGEMAYHEAGAGNWRGPYKKMEYALREAIEYADEDTKSNPYGSYRGWRYYQTAGTYKLTSLQGEPPFRSKQALMDYVDTQLAHAERAVANPADRSTHGSVVTYAMQEVWKGKSPATAAKYTAKKLSGGPNMFLGSPTEDVHVDPKVLEEAIWNYLATEWAPKMTQGPQGVEGAVLTWKFYDPMKPPRPDKDVETFRKRVTRSNPWAHEMADAWSSWYVADGPHRGFEFSARDEQAALEYIRSRGLGTRVRPAHELRAIANPQAPEADLCWDSGARVTLSLGEAEREMVRCSRCGRMLKIRVRRGRVEGDSSEATLPKHKAQPAKRQQNVGMLHAPYEQRAGSHVKVEAGPPPRRRSYADAMAGVRRAADAALREEIAVHGMTSGEFGMDWRPLKTDPTERLDMKAVANPKLRRNPKAEAWGRGSTAEEMLVRNIANFVDAKWRYDKRTGGIAITVDDPHRSVRLRQALDEERVPYTDSINKSGKIVYLVPHASQWWRHDHPKWKHLGDDGAQTNPTPRLTLQKKYVVPILEAAAAHFRKLGYDAVVWKQGSENLDVTIRHNADSSVYCTLTVWLMDGEWSISVGDSMGHSSKATGSLVVQNADDAIFLLTQYLQKEGITPGMHEGRSNPGDDLDVVREALARYGATLTPDGLIQSASGKVLQVRAVIRGGKKRKLVLESAGSDNTRPLASGPVSGATVSRFVEGFWFWKPNRSNPKAASFSTEFTSALMHFLTWQQQRIDQEFPSSKNSVGYDHGGRYAKVWRSDGTIYADGAPNRSVLFFVDTTDGTVYKAASWKQKSNTVVGNVYTWTHEPPSPHWVGGVGPKGRANPEARKRIFSYPQDSINEAYAKRDHLRAAGFRAWLHQNKRNMTLTLKVAAETEQQIAWAMDAAKGGTKSNPKASDREKFDKLRAKWLAIAEERRQMEIDAHVKYGPSGLDYAPASMKKRWTKLREMESKISDPFFELLGRVSPRDWMSGVPFHWVLGELPWEDVVRPAGEKLSVTPPIPYGYTHAKQNPSTGSKQSVTVSIDRGGKKVSVRLTFSPSMGFEIVSPKDLNRTEVEQAIRLALHAIYPDATTSKRRNTALSKAPRSRAVKHAERAYTSTHWSIPPTKAIHIDDPDIPSALTSMGTLTSITVKDKGTEIELDFSKYSPKCHLAFDPRKSKKLYNILTPAAEADVARRLISKDGEWYKLNDAQREFTDGRQKRYPFKKNVEVQLLGEIRRVLYFTNKKENAASKGQGGVATYDHAVGEETHRYPLLGVDRSGRLWWVGGAYDVRPGGIAD